jgi:hypothetical protein
MKEEEIIGKISRKYQEGNFRVIGEKSIFMSSIKEFF